MPALRGSEPNGVVAVLVYATLQCVVTLALLGLAYVVHNTDPKTSALIIGAVIAHWLHESPAVGRQLSSTLAARREPAGPPPMDPGDGA